MKCDKCDHELTIGDWPYCPHGSTTMRSGNGIFPYVTTHVDGKPMQIESLHHLRKIEKEYGVVFSAFSKDNVNDVDPVSKNLPRYRGDDPDFRGRR